MSSGSPSQDSSGALLEPQKPDEITSLEYSSLKVPYELFNKRFRFAQKSMERHNFRVRENAAMTSKAMKGDGSKPVYKREIKEKINAYMERLEQLSDTFKQVTEDELKMGHLLDSRVKYLQQANTTDELKKETWCNQRINRLIIDYLLRAGYFETAQKLAEQSDVEDMCNRSVFMIAKQVEDSLLCHETDRCLEWIADNKSKLRRLKSTLETNVRLQDCIELVRRGERLEAVHYARKFLANLAKEQWNEDVVKVMGLIGFGIPFKSRAYNEYFSPHRWTILIEQFRQENARVYKLMDHSSFNACLCMGLSALKTPQCHPDPGARCPTCRPEMYELAEELPYSHVSNSRLICAYSGEPLTSDNEPLMLPNGYVYGTNSIEKLRNSSDEIVCPRTGEVFQYSQLLRVFVL